MISNLFKFRQPSFTGILGFGALVVAATMLCCMVIALFTSDGMALTFLQSSFFVAVVGLFLSSINRGMYKDLSQRQRFAMVTFLWIWIALLGTLPYLLSGVLTNVMDAFFESMSGFTTTGVTVIDDVRRLAPSMMFWHSATQWLGGLFIVLVVFSIAPHLGLNNHSLYTAETAFDDTVGRVAGTNDMMIRRITAVYVCLSIFFAFLLKRSGLPLLSSVNLVMVSFSTGGFSTMVDIMSLTGYQQTLVSIAMMAGGVNMTVLYLFFTFRWNKMEGRREQVFCYLMIFLGLWLLLWLCGVSHDSSLLSSFVQSAAVVSTTGLVSPALPQWSSVMLFVIVLFSLVGGMAGSAAGGLKVMRMMVLFRNVKQILFKRRHPNAVTPVRLNNRAVSHSVINNVMVLFSVYVLMLIVGVFLLILCGCGASDSVGAIAGCLSTYGHAMSVNDFIAMPVSAKAISCLYMLFGRLECLVVLAVLL